MNNSSFQFSNPELKEVSFSVNDSFDDKKCDGIEMQSNTEVSLFDGTHAFVSLTVCIGNNTDAQPFNILITMGASFMWDEMIDEKTAKDLLNLNAPAMLLSYVRPIVANLTNCSRFPVLNIPFVDFTKTQVDAVN